MNNFHRTSGTIARNRSAAMPLWGLCLVLFPARLHGNDAEIRGVFAPADREKVRKVLLVDRDVPQNQVMTGVRMKEHPAAYDGKSGEFKATGLVASKTYDLAAELDDGTVLEGVDLRSKDADDSPLPEDGRAAIEKHFYGMKQFTNENRILSIAGNAKSAAVLVELCRTIDFHAGGGDVIWRVERWDYAFANGTWNPDGTRVLRRLRLVPERWRSLSWRFVPEWSGLKPGGEAKTFAIPQAPNVFGRWPGMKAEAPAAEISVKKKERVEDVKEEKDPDLAPPEK